MIQFGQASKGFTRKPDVEIDLEKKLVHTSEKNGAEFYCWVAELDSIEKVFDIIDCGRIVLEKNPDSRFDYEKSDYDVVIYDSYIE